MLGPQESNHLPRNVWTVVVLMGQYKILMQEKKKKNIKSNLIKRIRIRIIILYHETVPSHASVVEAMVSG